MKRNSSKKTISIIFAAMLSICLIVSGCNNPSGEGSSVISNMSASSQAENTSENQVSSEDYSSLAGIYNTKIDMTETQSVQLYLKIFDDGSFVFSRDTNFKTNEKGAGVIGKDSDNKDVFIYTVINAKNIEKGECTASYMVNENGDIQFTSPMWFGSTKPKLTGEDGNVTYPCFVKYDTSKAENSELSANSQVSVKETSEQRKESSIEKTSGNEQSKKSSSVPSEPSKQSSAVRENSDTATTVQESSVIEVTTEPSVQKPTVQETRSQQASRLQSSIHLQPLQSSIPSEIHKSEESPKPSQQSSQTQPSVNPSGSSAEASKEQSKEETLQPFKEGAYHGTLSKYVDAMNSNVKYNIDIQFKDGKYNYTVNINLSGAMEHTYTESYNGTYKVTGDTMSLTGKLSSGKIYGSSVTLTGYLSSFASQEETVTLFQ